MTTVRASGRGDDEVVMYLVIRSDMKMSKGKVAAQAGHAVQLAMRAAEARGPTTPWTTLWLTRWEAGSYPKIVLRAESETQLEAVSQRLCEANVAHAVVIDEGRTEIQAGTKTAVGVQPMPKSLLCGLVRWHEAALGVDDEAIR